MLRILRQYAWVLFTIIARPWTWLMLGFGLLYLVPFTGLWLKGGLLDQAALVSVPVVDAPPWLEPDFKELAAAGRLAEVTEWDARDEWPDGPRLAGAGASLVQGADAGEWKVLGQLPALERLWLVPPCVLSAEGWRRIGTLSSLEVLSVANVSNPAVTTPGEVSEAAVAALAGLPRLRQLDVRGTGFAHGGVLPRLASLEVCAIGGQRLEENLRTLADGSPRLHTLALETWKGFSFTPGTIEAMQRMPALRTVTLASTTWAREEPDMRRQIAELERALPGVRVLPGAYSPSRTWSVTVAALLAMFVPFVFWFQAGVLLSTASNWVLPQRLAAHLFWPIAVAAVCGGMLVGVARSIGAAWLPSVALALFASSLGAYGPFARDLAGRPSRITAAVSRIDFVIGILVAAGTLSWKPAYDRWLTGSLWRSSGIDLLVLLMVAGTLAWKLVRLARLPRILAEQGPGAVPGLALDATATMPRESAASGRDGAGGRFDLKWWLNDWAIDRQIAAAPPADAASAGGFATMLRRQQSQWQIPLMVAYMAVMITAVGICLPWIVARTSESPVRGPTASVIAPVFLAIWAWQGAAVALSMTAALWAQRRGGLAVDFLRPVSRRDYWRGIRAAIARDLVLPAILGGGAIVSVVAWNGGGKLLPWLVVATILVGFVALAHTMILLLATTKWPLVVGTITVVLFLAAALASVVAIAYAMTPVKWEHVQWAWLAAGGLFVVGVGARLGVLSRLESWEIG